MGMFVSRHIVLDRIKAAVRRCIPECVPIMRLHVQSSALDWTYSGPVIEVLSVEPSEVSE